MRPRRKEISQGTGKQGRARIRQGNRHPRPLKWSYSDLHRRIRTGSDPFLPYSMAMHSALRLPLSFDATALARDLTSLPSNEWITHFNQGYFDGQWDGLALRALPDAYGIVPDGQAPASAYEATTRLATCPALATALSVFQCPLKSVRLLRLTPGSVIREHTDPDLGLERGQARIHIPVSTNPGVEFYVDNRRIVMGPGECWFLGLNRPHRVQNLGATDRVHLVLDCEVNSWLEDLLAHGTPAPDQPSPPLGFDAFRTHALADAGLLQELAALPASAEFYAATVRIGLHHGFNFTIEDVRAARAEARREWVERQLV
jgi:Aspartyl/Asparaginyl beta-hydroxylase